MEAATAMRGLALWQITDAEQALAEKLMATGGEMTPELEQEWEALEGTFDAKAERIALYVRELQTSAAAAKEEADRLQGIHEAYATRAKRLKEYLKHHMERTGRLKVETPRARVWVQKSGGRPSIWWSGLPDTIPSGFRRVTVSLDGEAAREALDAGALPEGFVVGQVGTSLRIG